MTRELSEPWASGERVKSAINRAARLARLTYWRTYELWYRKARRVEVYDIEQIQEALPFCFPAAPTPRTACRGRMRINGA
jgi:hypothetical protein